MNDTVGFEIMKAVSIASVSFRKKECNCVGLRNDFLYAFVTFAAPILTLDTVT
jgi:hypothetical protein